MVFCEMVVLGSLVAFTLFEIYLFRKFCLGRRFNISRSEHVYQVPGGYYVVQFYPDGKNWDNSL